MRNKRVRTLTKKREDLGQVFTPKNIARLMSLLLLKKNKGKQILDPCVGGNVFFESISDLFPGRNYALHGIEIDPKSIDRDFFRKPARKLHIANFFDVPGRANYDYLIMNPPYVRHEKLTRSEINNKSKLESSTGRSFPGRTNLYVYFFAKALQHLKPGGKLVAICYDSWLFSEFGKEFKVFLKQNFSLDTLIHIRHSAFDDALVGATILELTKGGVQAIKPVRICVADKESIPMLRNIKEMEEFLRSETIPQEVFIRTDAQKYETVGERFPAITRGLETPANEYFYQGNLPSAWVRPVIKDTKNIKRYTVIQRDLGQVFIAPPRIRSLDFATRNYLRTIERQAPTKGYAMLQKLMTLKPESWFSLPEPKTGNIIFNYYLRNRVDFIYNPKRHIASNNFYVIESNDPFLDMAVLNSTSVRSAILAGARDQGKGLKKIQLYELRNSFFPNVGVLTKSNKVALRLLGRKLAKMPRDNAVQEVIVAVDLILEKEFGVQRPIMTRNNAAYALV